MWTDNGLRLHFRDFVSKKSISYPDNQKSHFCVRQCLSLLILEEGLHETRNLIWKHFKRNIVYFNFVCTFVLFLCCSCWCISTFRREREGREKLCASSSDLSFNFAGVYTRSFVCVRMRSNNTSYMRNGEAHRQPHNEPRVNTWSFTKTSVIKPQRNATNSNTPRFLTGHHFQRSVSVRPCGPLRLYGRSMIYVHINAHFCIYVWILLIFM